MGQTIWVENIYPTTDKKHWQEAMPDATRPIYVPATVEEVEDDFVTLKTDWQPPLSRTMTKTRLSRRTMQASIDHMAALDLDEAQVLDQLYRNHVDGAVYDVNGPVLLALNVSPKPVDLDAVFSTDVMDRYPINWGMRRRPLSWMRAKTDEADPRANMRPRAHVFGTARDALLKLGKGRTRVNVLVSGDCGGGDAVPPDPERSPRSGDGHSGRGPHALAPVEGHGGPVRP